MAQYILEKIPPHIVVVVFTWAKPGAALQKALLLIKKRSHPLPTLLKHCHQAN